MKNLKFNVAIIAIFAISFSLNSCGNKSNTTNQTEQKNKIEQTEEQGKEYTSAYICPMHCEGSGSTEPGNCPVCGMDYVKNTDHNHNIDE